MLSLADTTDLLDQTTTYLMGTSGPLTPQQGIDLMESWLSPLQAADNTKPLADELSALLMLLQARPLPEEAVREALNPLADQLSRLATEMGGEGEMPALLEGLSTALRQAGSSSKADTL
ncbi:hypothetical protein [Spirosoma endophyticum]|uniref:Uncharacterized protein n=1 Tax=Spirosoma endophyticum TaxID=662367 RepID=A0A1I2EV65_9BACT|nr:hypothetical protein [Spirosoma endophyticum]SFE96623.1 hypothetical protein SAMN05216167_12359 [Spirosoma endophyticum]